MQKVASSDDRARFELAEDQRRLAMVARASGDLRTADELLGAAVDDLAAMRARPALAVALAAHAEVLAELGRGEAATEVARRAGAVIDEVRATLTPRYDDAEFRARHRGVYLVARRLGGGPAPTAG